MNWCSIDETYLNYLKSYESRIPYSDYGVNHFNPFFRPLFEIEPGIIFVGAISHPQDRHRKMKNKPDFRKIFIPVHGRDGRIKKHFAGVVHLNYMFPAPESAIFNVTAQTITNFRRFSTEQQKSKYIDLLNKELKVINNEENIASRAYKLYLRKQKFPQYPISRRCFNYDKLIDLAKKWND